MAFKGVHCVTQVALNVFIQVLARGRQRETGQAEEETVTSGAGMGAVWSGAAEAGNGSSLGASKRTALLTPPVSLRVILNI